MALALHVSFRGKSYDVSLSDDASNADLFAAVSQIVDLPSSHLKLLYKGKALVDDISPINLPKETKLFAIGSEPKAVEAEEAVLMEQRRREAIRATRQTAVPRTTGRRAIGTLDTLDTARFHQINPFPEGPTTPHLAKRREMLERLAADQAILAIMSQHRWTVGELTELHPHTDPTLLGLNRNAGQSIALRLLTDRLDGLRAYSSVRRVLIHELVHNKHGPHELPFLELDSACAKAVIKHETEARSGGHRLGGELGEVFDPEARREAAALAAGSACTTTGSADATAPMGHRLGSTTGGPGVGDVRAARARAAEQRQKEA